MEAGRQLSCSWAVAGSPRRYKPTSYGNGYSTSCGRQVPAPPRPFGRSSVVDRGEPHWSRFRNILCWSEDLPRIAWYEPRHGARLARTAADLSYLDAARTIAE